MQLVAQILAVTATVGVTGCFLPLPYTETISPAVFGQYRRTDGSPGVGRRVAVSTARADSNCSRAVVRTTTDSAGGFAIPVGTARHRGFWFVPAIEHFPSPSYRLCVGDADSSLRSAYQGLWFSRSTEPPDTLACFESSAPADRATMCTGRRSVRRGTP